MERVEPIKKRKFRRKRKGNLMVNKKNLFFCFFWGLGAAFYLVALFFSCFQPVSYNWSSNVVRISVSGSLISFVLAIFISGLKNPFKGKGEKSEGKRKENCERENKG